MNVFRRTSTRILVLTLLCLPAGCRSAPQTKQATDTKEWDQFTNSCLDAYFVARPDVAVIAGRHEFHGKLPDWSKPGIEREIARLTTQRERALAFTPEALSERQQSERECVIADMEGALFKPRTPLLSLSNPDYYSFPLDPSVYVTRDYAPLAQRLRAYVAYAKALPTAVEQIRGNLQLPLPRTFVERGMSIDPGAKGFPDEAAAS